MTASTRESDGEHPRSLADTQGRTQEAEGAALRALHGLLKALDPAEHWADLRRTPTPDGNILWLCAEHRAVYEVKPLVLPTTEDGGWRMEDGGWRMEPCGQ